MAGRTPLQHIECFHLVFLRLLEARLDRASWVVKGGANIRAWFGSLRYSEDLDVDVVKGRTHVLAKRVDTLLASAALRELLAIQDLTVVRTTKPKQTETTQRWKFELRSGDSSVPLHTRAEFSRRAVQEDYVLEPVRPEIVRPYRLTAPTANHYTAVSAIRQKIHALAGRAETQARDVWDLEYLLRTTEADPRPLSPLLRKTRPVAIQRTVSLPYDLFKAQVVPYLAPEHQELWGTPHAWDRICELVVDRLTEFES